MAKTHFGLSSHAIALSALTAPSPDMPAACGAKNGYWNTKVRRRNNGCLDKVIGLEDLMIEELKD